MHFVRLNRPNVKIVTVPRIRLSVFQLHTRARRWRMRKQRLPLWAIPQDRCRVYRSQFFSLAIDQKCIDPLSTKSCIRSFPQTDGCFVIYDTFKGQELQR